jgi:lysozyme
MIRGADVSKYQGVINFDQLRPAIDFIIIRSTYGVGYKDAQFDRNWREAKRVGLPRAAYHYCYPNLGTSPIAEAAWFVSQVPLEPGDCLVLDFEVSLANPAAWCLAFLKEVEARVGFKPFFYTYYARVLQYDWTAVVNNNNGLWMAQYHNNVPADSLKIGPSAPKWWKFIAMWQYTSRGSLPGIVGNVDLNLFYGTVDIFKKYGKPAPAPAPIPVPVPEPTPIPPPPIPEPEPEPTPIPIPLPTPVPTPEPPPKPPLPPDLSDLIQWIINFIKSLFGRL